MTRDSSDRVVVIGAGIAGLACALRLAAAGERVTVLERAATPGGKMRTLPSAAGPVDAGPTVLTMRPVFEDLFAAAGTRLTDHVTLHKQECLARHFWPDGSRLDLFADTERSIAAVRDFAGSHAARQFRAFDARARRLFQGFEAPMMRAAQPRPMGLAAHVMRHPGLIRAMAPGKTLTGLLKASFDDPRLVQLFARYATYVGGQPDKVPGLLSLIWQAEAAGVWVVEGGMHALAQAIAALATQLGAEFRYNAHVYEITAPAGRVDGVRLEDGARIAADRVVFNGDPRALATGTLGQDVADVAPQTRRAARSLSAQVWAFASRVTGPDLAHHNVVFGAVPGSEFADLARGLRPTDPTVYICAQDRGTPADPPAQERFEMILNAPPITGETAPAEEYAPCQTRTFETLRRIGLSFDPIPGPAALTTPGGFAQLFPASTGSLYGQSPHGTMAAFQRPTARTPVTGLYLAGGGTHPGAGVPMATLSAMHAAAAIISDRTSPRRPPRRLCLVVCRWDLRWWRPGHLDHRVHRLGLFALVCLVAAPRSRKPHLFERGHLWAWRSFYDDRPGPQRPAPDP